LGAVIDLPAGDLKRGRQPTGIDGQMNLAGLARPACTDGLILTCTAHQKNFANNPCEQVYVRIIGLLLRKTRFSPNISLPGIEHIECELAGRT